MDTENQSDGSVPVPRPLQSPSTRSATVSRKVVELAANDATGTKTVGATMRNKFMSMERHASKGDRSSKYVSRRLMSCVS